MTAVGRPAQSPLGPLGRPPLGGLLLNHLYDPPGALEAARTRPGHNRPGGHGEELATSGAHVGAHGLPFGFSSRGSPANRPLSWPIGVLTRYSLRDRS